MDNERAEKIEANIREFIGRPFAEVNGLPAYVPSADRLFPGYEEHNTLEIRDGKYWRIDEVDGEEYEDDYEVPADGFAALGGDTTDMVGYLRHGNTVYLGRERTEEQLRGMGLLAVKLVKGNKYTGIGYSFIHYSPYELCYQLTSHGGQPVLAAGIDNFVTRDFLDQNLEQGKTKRYIFGYPLPSFEIAVKAAHLWPKSRVVAAKVPITVIDHDHNMRPSITEYRSWQLLHPFEIQLERNDTPAWFQSDDAIVELIEHPAMAGAIRAIDGVAWPIINEAYHYQNRGKDERFFKGLLIGAGALILGSLAADYLDGGFDDSSGELAGASSGAADVSGLEVFDSISVADGVSSSQEIGGQYANEVQFGSTVSVYDPSGVDKVKDVDFHGSYGKGADGSTYTMNQWGSVKKT